MKEWFLKGKGRDLRRLTTRNLISYRIRNFDGDNWKLAMEKKNSLGKNYHDFCTVGFYSTHEEQKKSEPLSTVSR